MEPTADFVIGLWRRRLGQRRECTHKLGQCGRAPAPWWVTYRWSMHAGILPGREPLQLRALQLLVIAHDGQLGVRGLDLVGRGEQER